MGMAIHDDVNGPMLPGAGYINMNIAADGTRMSAARAFLHPALSRPNLTLLLNTRVMKLNFTGTRCVGVKIKIDGAVKDLAADKEVILAAGAIGSPKLLMLSGVGEAKTLRGLGIDVVENLPGVGVNLQDHVLVSGVIFKYKGKMPDRLADSNSVDAEAYLSSGPSGDTDLNLAVGQIPRGDIRSGGTLRGASGRRIHDFHRLWCSRRAQARSVWPATTFKMPQWLTPTISARIATSRPSCARSGPRVNSEISVRSTVCAKSNWFPAPKRRPTRSANLLGLRQGAINIRWAPAKWASTTSLLWIPRCGSTDFTACAWPTPR